MLILKQKDLKDKIPYVKSAKMESPYPKDNRIIYHFFVNVKDIPDNFPTDVNPRNVTTKTKVYKKLQNGLSTDNESFFINNRGILISAKGVKVDSLNKSVEINLGNGSARDLGMYGVLDGGHTYHAVIYDHNDNIAQYVHLEVVVNIDNIDELAGARNTSVQVSDKAIAELSNKFQFVKDAIKDEPYSNSIAYKQNDQDKRLDTLDFIRLMYMFNIFKFSDDATLQPTSAYSGKAQVLKDYLREYDKGNDNPYLKLAPLLPMITKLYDKIQLEMKAAYSGRNFGNVKGIDKKEDYQTYYFENDCNYQISTGLIFPIVSAFRALVKENNDRLIWEASPIEVWEKVKKKLVNNTIQMSRSLGNNPQSAGKNASLWAQNYDAVNTEKLKTLLQEFSH